MATRSRTEETRAYYKTYYTVAGSTRNDLRCNRGVLMQNLAMHASLVRLLAVLDDNPEESRVLDVGCGTGWGMVDLCRLRYRFDRMVGIDVLPERLAEAKAMLPQGEFVEGDATSMPFADSAFDLVFESTLFATIGDRRVARGIAREMQRVCRPGGHLVLVDWRYRKPCNSMSGALSKADLYDLFLRNTSNRLVKRTRGALVPPLGRFLSTYLSSVYFLVGGILPFAVGQVAYLIQKDGAAPQSPR